MILIKVDCWERWGRLRRKWERNEETIKGLRVITLGDRKKEERSYYRRKTARKDDKDCSGEVGSE